MCGLKSHITVSGNGVHGRMSERGGGMDGIRGGTHGEMALGLLISFRNDDHNGVRGNHGDHSDVHDGIHMMVQHQRLLQAQLISFHNGDHNGIRGDHRDVRNVHNGDTHMMAQPQQLQLVQLISYRNGVHGAHNDVRDDHNGDIHMMARPQQLLQLLALLISFHSGDRGVHSGGRGDHNDVHNGGKLLDQQRH